LKDVGLGSGSRWDGGCDPTFPGRLVLRRGAGDAGAGCRWLPPAASRMISGTPAGFGSKPKASEDTAMTLVKRMPPAVAMAWVAAAVLTVHAAPLRAKTPPKRHEELQRVQCVFTAMLESVTPGPVARSYPPIYTHRLSLTPKEVLRGEIEPGKTIEAVHRARQMQEPTFPVGKMCLVLAEKAGGGLTVARIEPLTDEILAEARAAIALPLGWSVVDGKPVSPWAKLGAKAWPGDVPAPEGAPVCGKTGRPAFQAGAAVQLGADPVPPAKQIRWTNPDGDGEYKITVTNTTDQAVKVPALLADGEKVLWDECLVIICQGKGRPLPTAQGISGPVKPVELGPGESVSTVVNTFLLSDIQWPRGGYRVEFQFCLGELSVVRSFYYMSKHHDPIREQAVEAMSRP
jgi:hypothetical protein